MNGCAISKPLPTHGFKWMTEEELENWKNQLHSRSRHGISDKSS